MPKFTGRFICKDIANDRQYLADLLFGSESEDLALWTLLGTTPPTAVGRYFDFFNNINAANQDSWMRYQIPNTRGQFFSVTKCKFTRMVDDTSVDWQMSFLLGIAPSAVREQGATYLYVGLVPAHQLEWNNTNYTGSNPWIATGAFVAGVEHEVAVIVAPSEVVLLLDGVRTLAIPIGAKGTAPLSSVPSRDFCSANKNVIIGVRHQAAEVSHFQVRDIKIGRLVGVSV